jgi:hypothetical protein
LWQTLQCEFYTVNPDNFKASSYCSVGGYAFGGDEDDMTEDSSLEADETKHWVEKKLTGTSLDRLWRPACNMEVRVTYSQSYLFGPDILLGYTGNGVLIEFERSECTDLEEKVCYIAPNGDYRLIWAQQEGLYEPIQIEGDTPLTRTCAGWVIEALTLSDTGSECAGCNGIGPAYMTWRPDTCPDGPAFPGEKFANDLGYAEMYLWKPRQTYPSLEYVCKGYPRCGTMQTCVLSKNRFETEMATC